MVKIGNRSAEMLGIMFLTGVVLTTSSCINVFAGQKEQLCFRPFASEEKSPYAITIEKGTVYDLSSVISLESKDTMIGLDQVSGEVYKSSKAGVASVSREGRLKALKVGKSNIIISYNGKKIKLKVAVVKPKYVNDQYAKALNKSLNKFAKGISNQDSFTEKNRLSKLKQRVQVLEAEKKFNENVSGDIFADGYYKHTLIAPRYVVFERADIALFNYGSSLNPEVPKNKDALKMKDIKAKSDQVVITLNQNITSDQVFGMLYKNLSDLSVADISKGNRAKITVGVTKDNSGSEYELRGDLISGNDTIVLEPYVKNGETHQWSKTTLPAGEWKVWDEDHDEWIYGKSFTVERN